MTIKQQYMNGAGIGIAVLGLVFFLIALFGTAQCRTPFSFSGESEEVCVALLDLDPFEEGDDFSMDQWAIRNNFALLMIGSLIGSLIALAANNRVAMFIGGLGFAAAVVMIYLQLSIGISDSDSTSLEWAWIPLFLSAICLIVSAFLADPPYSTDSAGLSIPPAAPAPPTPPPAMPTYQAQSSSALTTARALAGVGLFILVFGGTLAPAFCNDTGNLDCGIGGEGSFFQEDAFDDSFKEGIQLNFIGITVLLMTGIGLVAAAIKHPRGVSVAGWSALGYLAFLFIYFWAIAASGNDSIFDYTKWGWIGMFGGPILLFVAANFFNKAEDEAIAARWQLSHAATSTPEAGTFSSSSPTWATSIAENVADGADAETSSPDVAAVPDDESNATGDDPS